MTPPRQWLESTDVTPPRDNFSQRENQGQSGPVDVAAFLFSDVLLLALPQRTKGLHAYRYYVHRGLMACNIGDGDGDGGSCFAVSWHERGLKRRLALRVMPERCGGGGAPVW
jgi:hypothetical protein|eukprot:COSAG06_NODE_10190_length_1732_cov_1.178812_2_plen_112_part_00